MGGGAWRTSGRKLGFMTSLPVMWLPAMWLLVTWLPVPPQSLELVTPLSLDWKSHDQKPHNQKSCHKSKMVTKSDVMVSDLRSRECSYITRSHMTGNDVMHLMQSYDWSWRHARAPMSLDWKWLHTLPEIKFFVGKKPLKSNKNRLCKISVYFFIVRCVVHH